MPVDANRRGSFGQLLRKYRYRAGLSQELLAERAGLSLRGIQDLERGVRRNPYPGTTRRVADALHLDASDQQALMDAAAPSVRRRTSGNSASPFPLTRFVGRQRELEQLSNDLLHSRLLTLTGPGGVGKTRMALELARDWPPTRVEPIVCELASVRQPERVGATLAELLGVIERPGEQLLATLSDTLSQSTALFVLDNCEHLLGACAELIEHLLRACPRISILATSREPVGVGGEVVWQVRPLSVPDRHSPPDLTNLLAYEAVELFVDRARAAQPDFALSLANASAVADVCRRLDGLPLAVEFAAARISTLSAQQISQRLDLRLLTNANRVVPSRHRTLEAVLGWSHDLLSEPERILFRRLSIFLGDYSLEAVEQVCADHELESAAVLEALTRLVRASLVVVDTRGDEARFSLLETTRAYAREQLERAGEQAEFRGRHMAFYLALAEEAEAHLSGPDQVAWLDKLQVEQDNLWAVLEWCCVSVDAVHALRMAGALQFFWHLRGTFSEGIRWLQRSLELSGPTAASVRAKALWSLGALSVFVGDIQTGMPALQESLSLAQAAGDRSGIARALSWIAQLAGFGGDVPAARRLLAEASEAAARAGDTWCQSDALGALGWLQTLSGRPVEAELALDRALAVARDAGDSQGQRFALGGLSLLALRRGQLEVAATHSAACLEILAALGGGYSVATQLAIQSGVECARGDRDTAIQLANEAVALARQSGSPMVLAGALEARAACAVADGNVSVAVNVLEEAVECARRGAPALLAWLLGRLATVVLARGDRKRAATLLADARAAAMTSDDIASSARIDFACGRLAGLEGNRQDGVLLLRGALEAQKRLGFWPDALDSLDALAEITQDKSPTQAGDYAAEAAALRGKLGIVPTYTSRRRDGSEQIPTPARAPGWKDACSRMD